MKRVIITGPTGAVGVGLIRNLIKKGIEVIAVVRPGSNRVDNIPKDPLVKVVSCALGELGKLPALVDGQVDVFYHLGWDGTYGNARNNMPEQVKNIQYALSAVGVAHKLGCQKFVGVGSQAEYGRVEGVLKSDTPVQPENGYGMAKLAAGQMTRQMCFDLGMEHNWVRILSVYGPCDGENTMVMSLIRQLQQNQRPALTAGEQIWDYLYAEDAGNALMLVGSKGIDGKIYVLGSGQGRPLKEYIEEIRDEINPGAELGFGEVPYGEKQVMYLVADISELTADTGFEPKVAFRDGVRKMIIAGSVTIPLGDFPEI